MGIKETFLDYINEGNITKGDFIPVGAAMLDGETITGAHVKIPLKTLNRHGLIAGATGTGKTKSMQVMAEQLSLKGIPCLLMDIKGDLSGLAQPSPGHLKIDERHKKIGLPFTPKTVISISSPINSDSLSFLVRINILPPFVIVDLDLAIHLND